MKGACSIYVLNKCELYTTLCKYQSINLFKREEPNMKLFKQWKLLCYEKKYVTVGKSVYFHIDYMLYNTFQLNLFLMY